MQISNNRDANKVLYELVMHESGHRMEQLAPAEFGVLMDALYERAEGRSIRLGVSQGLVLDSVKAQHDNAGIMKDTRGYMEEFAVRELETIFGSPEEFNKWYAEISGNQQVKTAWEKFISWLSEVIEDIKKAWSQRNMTAEEKAEAKKAAAELERIKGLLASTVKAAENAAQNRMSEVQGGRGQKNTNDKSDVDFNLKETTENNDDTKRQNAKDRFYSQLNNWDGETTGFSFVLGTTSKALIDAEVPNKQIRWDASKIKTLLNKHNGMTLDVVRQIPNLLEKPVVVIDSKQDANARIIIGDLHDANGKLVTVVLLLTPTSKKGNQIDVIKVSSAQGRSHIESLFRNKDGSNVKVRFVDKERIHSWLNVNRLQLPLHSFNLDSNDSIPQTEEKSQEKLEDVFKEDKSVKRDFRLKEDNTQYTDQEYRDFGWARENGILSADQNADYRSKFAMAKSGQMKFPKSKKGEFIIPVSDIYDSDKEGINNVLVFAKGTIDKPIVTSIIEIYEYDETSLDRIRRRIYDCERRGIQQEAGELFERYDAVDYELRPNQQRIGFESLGNSSDNGHGERSRGETSSIKGETRVNFSLKGTNNISTKDRKALLDIIEHLKGEFKITKFAKADPKKLAKMTKALLKEYNSLAEHDANATIEKKGWGNNCFYNV